MLGTSDGGISSRNCTGICDRFGVVFVQELRTRDSSTIELTGNVLLSRVYLLAIIVHKWENFCNIGPRKDKFGHLYLAFTKHSGISQSFYV